jgi:hypothetical protein
VTDEKEQGQVQQATLRGSSASRNDRSSGDQGALRPLDWPAEERAELDVLPRQIARFVDPSTGSEWVVDARRCGAMVQVRAVEYASDGSWMPHVWRDVPDGATVWFIEGHGIEVRGAR